MRKGEIAQVTGGVFTGQIAGQLTYYKTAIKNPAAIGGLLAGCGILCYYGIKPVRPFAIGLIAIGFSDIIVGVINLFTQAKTPGITEKPKSV